MIPSRSPDPCAPGDVELIGAGCAALSLSLDRTAFPGQPTRWTLSVQRSGRSGLSAAQYSRSLDPDWSKGFSRALRIDR